MNRKFLAWVALAGVLALVAGVAVARQYQRRFRRPINPEGPIIDRAGVPDWKVDDRYPKDVFTFVRVQYDSHYGGRGFGRYGGYGGGHGWATDYPDCELNFSYRLQQLTSLRVNPNPIVLRLNDPRLLDYPFIYMSEPGSLSLSDDEVAGLRRYLWNGGFMMVDDFWGDAEYEVFYEQIKRVFPDREPEELKLDHDIFQCVYKLKERPQVPSIHEFERNGNNPNITWEEWHVGNVRDVHYRGILDDKGRLMVIICHNTDLGDGWEREGESPDFFKIFSAPRAYPMGINIVTYAMTH
jgi:hypothetical protein